MVRVLDWNGKDLPAALRELPAGRYVVERADELPELTENDEEGLRQALASIRAGRGVSLEAARAKISATRSR
jgi:hypothetical protein